MPFRISVPPGMLSLPTGRLQYNLRLRSSSGSSGSWQTAGMHRPEETVPCNYDGIFIKISEDLLSASSMMFWNALASMAHLHDGHTTSAGNPASPPAASFRHFLRQYSRSCGKIIYSAHCSFISSSSKTSFRLAPAGTIGNTLRSWSIQQSSNYRSVCRQRLSDCRLYLFLSS